MTPKERLETVLAGGIPDRVPVSTYEMVGWDEGSFYNRDESYHRLMERIREATDCLWLWHPGGMVHEGGAPGCFLTAADVPSRVEEFEEGGKRIWVQTVETPGGPLRCVRSRMEGVETVWTEEHWLKSEEDVERFLSVPYEFAPPDCSGFAAAEERLGEGGVMLPDVADPLCYVADFFEFGEFTVQALTNTAMFRRMLDAMHERVMDRLRWMLDAGVRGLWRYVGPEYASEPYLPPALFDELVTPYMKDIIGLIHSYGQRVRVHSHGRLRGIIDRFVEAGADATDPCEAPPDGDMELAEIKALYGDALVLFGNIQLKHLETDPPGRIEQRVRACMDAAKSGGGYVIMPTASPINTPLSPRTEENYLRFIDAALEYGGY